ncbi:nitroreductase family deazaflavin-dependent oxidoreductase [Actinoallomurus sp. NBC_01490]|uniref:nitroreductase family deazaflavin-dependent oxidoreductase n=1 Tax=Actinoallomurus sp. NBC_01490 TaxID=2903557 RepID=UPI002E36CF5D|nr:nitroreductase family deazaflavin-dependent oxidoreductase [Actinoallomurus sp. NBC_01490]
MLFGREHVERYQETDGAEGHDWQGTTVLLLTTVGRKSGQKRTSPLIYRKKDGDTYTVIASNGGADEPPLWYANLQADPEVEVQVWGEKFVARARTATPEEKPALWEAMAETWPAYDDYQKKTEREIPVVVLERV